MEATVPDVLTLLEADHRRVESILQALAESEEGPERDRLVKQLVASLTVHMEFEEQAVYPLMRELDAEMEEEGEIEHGLARDGLTKVVELANEPGFGAVVDMLTAGIAHHVEDEEEEAFPMMRDGLDQQVLDDLAATLLDAKRKAGVLADELALANKSQLVEMAKVRGISGRSSMTADELRTALSA